MRDEKRIFSLHYVGARFSNNRLPVEVLSDLQAFKELLLSFTKDEWRKAHPERKKLPKNFSRELSLSLFDIEDGSAIPKLEWSRPSEDALLFPLHDDFEAAVESAYQAVIDLIDPNHQLAGKLDAPKLSALNRLGAALHDGERIDFAARDQSGKVVSLDMHRRKQLIGEYKQTYSSRVDGSGELIGTTSPSDPNGQCYIELDTPEFGKISIPVDRLQLYEEFADFLNSEVRFDLLVELDLSDRFKSVLDVFEVALQDDPHAEAISEARERLESFCRLEEGWLDGAGKPIERRSINAALDFIVATRSLGIDVRVFPTESGGVLVDATVKSWEYSLDFSPLGTVEMYGVDVSSESEMRPTTFGNVDEVIPEFLRRAAVQ